MTKNEMIKLCYNDIFTVVDRYIKKVSYGKLISSAEDLMHHVSDCYDKIKHKTKEDLIQFSKTYLIRRFIDIYRKFKPIKSISELNRCNNISNDYDLEDAIKFIEKTYLDYFSSDNQNKIEHKRNNISKVIIKNYIIPTLNKEDICIKSLCIANNIFIRDFYKCLRHRKMKIYLEKIGLINNVTTRSISLQNNKI